MSKAIARIVYPTESAVNFSSVLIKVSHAQLREVSDTKCEQKCQQFLMLATNSLLIQRYSHSGNDDVTYIQLSLCTTEILTRK